MSFKDMVKRDIKGVFLNTDEFAQLHTKKPVQIITARGYI